MTTSLRSNEQHPAPHLRQRTRLDRAIARCELLSLAVVAVLYEQPAPTVARRLRQAGIPLVWHRGRLYVYRSHIIRPDGTALLFVEPLAREAA